MTLDLRTIPSSGQAATNSLRSVQSSCLPLKGSVRCGCSSRFGDSLAWLRTIKTTEWPVMDHLDGGGTAARITLDVGPELLEQIDALRARLGLRSRGTVVIQLLQELLNAPEPT